MSLCILAAGKTTVLAVASFTLAWTHSVERTRWIETWTVTETGLKPVEARVKGSGAGMEPPEGARLEKGWWVFRPSVPFQSRLALAASGATGAGWKICGGGTCLSVGAAAADRPVMLSACAR